MLCEPKLLSQGQRGVQRKSVCLVFFSVITLLSIKAGCYQAESVWLFLIKVWSSRISPWNTSSCMLSEHSLYRIWSKYVLAVYTKHSYIILVKSWTYIDIAGSYCLLLGTLSTPPRYNVGTNGIQQEMTANFTRSNVRSLKHSSAKLFGFS